MNEEDKVKSLTEALKQLYEEAKIGSDDITAGFANMVGGAEELIKQFGIGRQRMQELMGAVTDATPAVDRLGGNLKDAVETIEAVGKATRRNVVAGEEQVSKLFASSQVLNQEVGTIVESFSEIGVEFTQVGGKIEESIQYIQSVGGNARQIMTNVLNDMSAMNKFNFQDGVVGLTKMAAQAAMLKTDMRVTMELAEKALDPEGAIELASAFQRLGVSAGDLTDPFQLMNKSLNDPEGLQNSIVNMSKQFAYFDEKAGQFKINPQGMLMMRELQKQTGLSSQELSKMALNAADLDKKLSQIRPDIQFENEEDKKYLANIAKMGKGGKYEITIDDKQVELEKLTQQQMDKLIDEQKKGPKTVEDLQRAQLDAFTLVKSDVRSIKDKVVLGIVSTPTVREGAEGTRAVFAAGSNALASSADLKMFRDGAEKSMDLIKNFVSAVGKGEGLSKGGMNEVENALKELQKLQGKGDEGLRTGIEKFLQENANNNTEIGRAVQKFVQKEYDESQLKKGSVKDVDKMANANPNTSGEIMGEIKTTTSSINTKIDNLDSKVGKIATPVANNMGNTTVTEIVREIKTTMIDSDKQVVVSFDSSKPAIFELNIKGEGAMDFAKMEDKLINSEKLKEDFAKNIERKMQEMNFGSMKNIPT
jgi:hypothetical protein